MQLLDWIALSVFILVWIGYDPLLGLIARHAGSLNSDMLVVRDAWMRAMTVRQLRLVDSQLMGHTMSSASFFASTNLILIAAVASVLFGGESAIKGVMAISHEAAPVRLLEGKLALVLLTLARGLLDFVWALRQLNYTVALIGAAPEIGDDVDRDAFGAAVGKVLNPALASFNRGVRGYYFALAGAAWLFGSIWLLISVISVMALLLWRQSGSPAAHAVRTARRMLEK